MRNLERTRATKAAYHIVNREKSLAASKRNREKNKYLKPWVKLLQCARARAKDRGIAYELSPEWALTAWTGRCAITGIAFAIDVSGKRGPKPFSASIDRIDNSRGYEPNNCRFILMCVNNFRGTLGDEAMLVVAKAIACHDRDVNAALNILLRGLGHQTPVEGIAASRARECQ